MPRLLAALLLFALATAASASTTSLDVCSSAVLAQAPALGPNTVPPVPSPTTCYMGNATAISSPAPGLMTTGVVFQAAVRQYNLPANTSTGVCFTFRSSCSASDVAFVMNSSVFLPWKLYLLDFCKGGGSATHVSIHGAIPHAACFPYVAYTISVFAHSDVDVLFCNKTNCNGGGAPPPPPPGASGAGASGLKLSGVLAWVVLSVAWA